MKSTKYPLKSSFKPSKSSKSREDLRNKKSGSIGTKLAVKSAKILSQAKNRSNTLYSLQCSKSKLEINSSTPSKEPSLHERCRILKRENTCLEKNLEQMQGYKKETELLTKLLLEILPILKAQYNLEEYQSKDFRTGDTVKGTPFPKISVQNPI